MGIEIGIAGASTCKGGSSNSGNFVGSNKVGLLHYYHFHNLVCLWG